MSDFSLPPPHTDQHTYRHILVATGGAPHSQKAVDRAAQIAQQYGAVLHIITVVPQAGSPMMNVAAAFPGGEYYDAQAKQDDYARRGAYLHSTAAHLRTLGLQVEEHLVPALKAADAILAVAQEAGIDLIVLGRKHTTALSAALAGSVADAVSHASPVDVLIAR